MAETRDDTLRALIRLIPPARALKEDLERSLHLEIYAGTGNMAVKSYQGIQASVARITDDPYVEALSPGVPENATDKEKVSLARLAAGQLLAYLEGQTGLVGLGGRGEGVRNAPDFVIQKAPTITNLMGGNAGPVQITPELADKISGIVEKAMQSTEEEQEEEAEK